MSNNTITLHWSIPCEVWGKELLSLTWSATILEIWGNKVLVDLWLFQWWEWSEIFNKQNINFLNNIDSVIISHPHIDHIWRLPLLFKHGFRGAIYMTPASKEITTEMLKDSYKIQEEDKIERINRNEKLWYRLRLALKIKQCLLTLENNSFVDKQEKQLNEDYLNKKLWKWYNSKKSLDEISEYLDFHWVKENWNIERVISELKEMLFSEEDMYWVLSLIQPLDYWEEKIISNKKISYKNNNSENQETLNNLPEKVANWYNWEVSVYYKSEKRKLRSIWTKKLEENIKFVVDSNPDLEEQKNELKKFLDVAFSFCYESYAFLYDKNNPNIKDFIQPEYKEIKKHLQKYKNLLEKYNIKTKDDICKLIEDKEKIIDLFKINIPYNSDDIKKASNLIKIENIFENKRQVIGITLTDASHVVWSASINIVSWETKRRVQNLLEINWNATSVCFSGDLWRIKSNRLWKPELPGFPVNYLQIETTYAWREHRNKKESIKDLINSIESSNWNVLISVFSQHRLQEILMTLLEEKIKNKEILNNEILIDAPLWSKLTDIYIQYKWEIFNLLEEKAQKEIFWWVVFRFLAELEWMKIYEKQNNEWYNSDEAKENNKKLIILASSGMMEWWAIMNHLPNILTDSNATILSPGYLCKWTLGHEIVIECKENVTIAWKKYEVKCNKKFLDGFSSHISHSEILEYISNVLINWKFKLDSTISLNHWVKEWQKILKKDIEELLKHFDRTDIKVTIPEMFNSYNIKTRKNIRKGKNIELLTAVKWVKKWVIPTFLLWNSNLKNTLDAPKEEENIKIQRSENNTIITDFQNELNKIIWKITKDQKLLSKNFLLNLLNKFSDSKLANFLWEITKLWDWQSKNFYNLIDKKLSKNKSLKSSITILKNKIRNIDIIYNLIVDFINNINYGYLDKINNFQNEINTLEDEIIKLEDEFTLFKNNKVNNKDVYQSFVKQILTKKRRVKYLNKEIRELNYLITWESEDLEKEIENKRLKVKEIEKEIEDKKLKETEWKENENDKKKLEDLKKIISLHKKEIQELKNKIFKIKSKRINFENRLKSNIPSSFHDKLTEIFIKLWKWDDDNTILVLKNLCFDSILDLKSDIEINKCELNSHISTYIEPRKQSFKWKNIYDELFESNSGNIDLEKFKEYIAKNFFSTEDKKYIEKQLLEYEKLLENKKTFKYLLWKYYKNIRKFIKNKQDANNDLWISLEISISEINKESKNILANIFEKKYFDDYIYPNFDIYIFLKSRENFLDYIQKKYNLKQLKWYSKEFSKFDEIYEKIDGFHIKLEQLKSLNQDSSIKKDLENLHSSILEIIKEAQEKY